MKCKKYEVSDREEVQESPKLKSEIKQHIFRNVYDKNLKSR